MPTTQVAQNAEARRKEIETLLHNGHEVSLKDIGWLVYGINNDMKEMALCEKSLATRLEALVERLEQGVNKPPSRLWQVAQETFVKSAAVLVWGLVLWMVVSFVNSGFKIP